VDPVGTLSRYNGLSAKGDWKILVSDQNSGSTGTLNSWSLIVTPKAYTVTSFSDATTPTVAVTPTGTVTSSTPITFTLTFSEQVTGLTASGITVTNGTKGTLSGSGAVYTIQVTPTARGVVTCMVNAGSAQDPSLNNNAVSNTASVTFDNAPTFNGYTASTSYQIAASISFSKVLSKAADADGDTLSVSAAGPASAQGGMAVLQGGSILYTPPVLFSGTDTFPIVISDTYGATVGGTVTVTVRSATGGGGQGSNPPQLTILSGGRMGITFQGIPGRNYLLQRSTNLTTWQTLSTLLAGTNGSISYIDESPPPGSAYYRIAKP
jgi:hypothetical protein